MMNLDDHGAACRCLLRLQENQGAPGTSDADFITRFLPRYPQWRERPGATDPRMIVEIARELRLASSGETFHEYARVLQEHRAGRSVLLTTAHAPEQSEPLARNRPHVMLLVDMTEDHFTAWCPFPSGNSDTLPPAARIWWDRWQTRGLVLDASGAGVTS